MSENRYICETCAMRRITTPATHFLVVQQDQGDRIHTQKGTFCESCANIFTQASDVTVKNVSEAEWLRTENTPIEGTEDDN